MEVNAAHYGTTDTTDSEESDRLKAHQTLEQEFTECTAAFHQWEIDANRSDMSLYRAIAQLYLLCVRINNRPELLLRLAGARGMRITKVSSIYTIATKLTLSGDRQKISKYASVLRFLDRQHIVAQSDDVVTAIKTTGGIEACARLYRSEVKESTPTRLRSAGSARFDGATRHLMSVSDCVAPADLNLDMPTGTYFLLLGHCDAAGNLRLVNRPVQDEMLVRGAIGRLAQKNGITYCEKPSQGSMENATFSH